MSTESTGSQETWACSPGSRIDVLCDISGTHSDLSQGSSVWSVLALVEPLAHVKRGLLG